MKNLFFHLQIFFWKLFFNKSSYLFLEALAKINLLTNAANVSIKPNTFICQYTNLPVRVKPFSAKRPDIKLTKINIKDQK